MIDEVIENKTALNKFREIIIAQGGNPDVINDYSLFKIGKNIFEIKAQKEGYISKLDALDVAFAAKLLGAGRDKKSDKINFEAGVLLDKKVGDFVKKDETIMKLYYDDVNEEKLNDAINIANKSVEIVTSKVNAPKLIYK